MELDLDSASPRSGRSLQLRVLYEGAGFRKYHMGRFEEYSLYQENRRFPGRGAGHHLYGPGRAAAGAQAGRDAVHRQKRPAGPGECLRYYYTENVYRPSQESHTFREISQMGLEYIGAVDAGAAAPRPLPWRQTSWRLTGADYVLELSHMGFVTGCWTPWARRRRAAPAAGVPAAQKRPRASAGGGRGGALPQGIDALRRLPALAGEWEQVLSAADTLALNASMGDALRSCGRSARRWRPEGHRG
jgi:ATP phosphoribosyltransferase